MLATRENLSKEKKNVDSEAGEAGVESQKDVSNPETTASNASEEQGETKTSDKNADKDEQLEGIEGNGKITKGQSLLSGRNKTRGDVGNDDFVPTDGSVFPPLIEFYGLSDDFPIDQFMARCTNENKASETKVVYFVSKTVKTLMDYGIQDRLTVINSGLKAFERNSKECDAKYRLTQDAIHFTATYMKKRKISVCFDDYSKCIASGAIRLETFTDEFAASVRELAVGAFVVVLKGFETNLSMKMFMVMWRCRGDALNCLVAKIEMDGMRSKLRALKETDQN